MTARRSGAVAVAAVVATALVVVLLVAWAASIGPSGVLTGTGPSPVGTPSDQTANADARPSVPGQEPVHHSTPAWVRTSAFVLDLVMTGLAVYLLLRFLVAPLGRWGVHRHRARLRRKRRGATGDDEDFVVLGPAQAVAEQMLADAGAQREELLTGDTPRNAVVTCWHRFETQAAAAGVARRPWETSSEYTMRVLDLVDAHQPAVSRLGALYREARFSEHELTEAHRAEALAALDAIHRTIGIPV